MTCGLVLFDVDGTLLEAGGSGRWAMTRAFEEVFGIRDAGPFSGQVRFDGMTDPGILEAIAVRAAVPAARLHERRAGLERSFLGHLQRRLASTASKRPLPGVVGLLDRLAGNHSVGLGLATGNIEQGARLKLASVGLSGYFRLGGFGGDAPDRAGIVRIARERFERSLGRRIDPGGVVVVGDSVEDIRAARANGHRSLAVGTGGAGRAVLEAERPDLYAEDLSDHGALLRFLFGSSG